MTEKNKEEKKESGKGWNIQITAKAVIVNANGKVLLLKRANNEKTNSLKYDLPGGSIEKGESIKMALIREIEEETGLTDIKIESILRVSEYPEGHEKFDDLKALRFLVYCNSGEVKLNPREHGEYEWMEIDEAIKKLNTGDGFEEEKLETLKEAKKYLEMQNSLDGWRRCQADFENYKKRQAESQKDLIRYSTQNIVLQILPVIDNFHISTDHIPEDQKNNPWVVGIMHIQKQLEQVLMDNGVTEIDVKIGDEFDPNLHEAIANNQEEESEDKKEGKNKIKKIVLKGYKIGEKVVRAARVVVE